jgi:hypothetical protein
MPTPRAWYALRRTLVPWNFYAALADLVTFCRQYGVDEVILKCDTEEFSHGIPTVEWLQAYQPRLHEARAALAEIGVAYSLNPWVTQGHIDRGRDLRTVFPDFRMQVGHDGSATKAQACPLCAAWRAHTAQLWTLYADTRPKVIWVEDDIRTFNHLPVRYGCFCAEHLRRFSARVGEPVDRAALVGALLAPGTPHPWRAVWLDLQAEVMIDTVRFLQETVHRASPDTCLGLMSSGADSHALEGRRWGDFGAALAGNTPLYSRPPLGSYNEDSLRGLYYTARSIKQTRHHLPGPVVEQTEVENWPFTRYSKSTAFTALQMAVSLALGCEGVTLNLFDHIGNPLAAQAPWGEMLAGWRPFLDSLAARAQGKAPHGGVRLLSAETFSYAARTAPGCDYSALGQMAHGWAEPLEALGFPITFDESPVTALTGQVARALSADALEALLATGVLLDGSAADVLCQLGYADVIGTHVERIVAKDDWVALAAEEWNHPAFGGLAGEYLTMTLPDLGGGARLALARPHAKAQIVSRLIDMDHREVAPYVTAFENGLGGRVVVLPYVLDGRYLSLLNPARKRQLSILLRWLSRDSLPLEVTARDGAYPLPVLRRFPDHTLLGAFNLTLDPWPAVTFDLAETRAPAAIQRLQADGSWTDADVAVARDGGRLRITVTGEVDYRRPLFLDVRWTG